VRDFKKKLKERLPDLDLTPAQRRIANLMLEGRTVERIVLLTDLSARVVNTHMTAIYLAIRRSPPDADVTTTGPKSPRPSPKKAARALSTPK
jgi:hypothetical protein